MLRAQATIPSRSRLMHPEQSDFFGISHLDEKGRARMVDVGEKTPTSRRALAAARIRFSSRAWGILSSGTGPKGGLVETARIAGIQGAKKASDLVPLCHPLALDSVDLEITPAEDGSPCFEVRCEVKSQGKTGVEMEALTGAALASLTLYDMGKALGEGAVIEEIRLLKKTGGKSGDWEAK